MEFIKSWKFMALIGGVLAAAAIAGVIYGVATHEEAGVAESTMWTREDMPLVVCSEDYGHADADNVWARERVDAAVRTINDRLGFDALRAGEIGCHVYVVVNAPTEPGWHDPGGDADLSGERCEVQTAHTGTLELTGLVIQHELGHCLGLLHDSYPASIMYGCDDGCALVPTPDGEFPPRISDSDRDLLRGMYGPE